LPRGEEDPGAGKDQERFKMSSAHGSSLKSV